MSAILGNQLRAYGVTSILVFLKEGVDVGGATGVLKHFVHSENSQLSALAASAGIRRGTLPPGRYYPNLGVMLGTVSAGSLAALRADRRVRKVSGLPPIRMIRPVHKAAAKLTAAATWGMEALEVRKLWDQGLDGKGVAVAHLDTGADGKHPTLRKAIAGFAEFDHFGRQRTPAPKPHDTDDHGTHTAATIAGRPVAGRAVGLAPKADLHSAIVIEGGDVVARVIGGMDWAVGRGVKVLSMSLGFPGYWDDFLELTRILRGRGVLPVMAVGNEGPGTSRSPGNYAEALSVGACDSKRRVAGFSSSDRFKRKRDPIVPDLVAPGVDVISAQPGGRYQSMSGTSMATPHVAGLAALLLQARPNASVQAIERAILRSCTPLKGIPPGRQGSGFPNGPRALAAL